MSRAQWPRAPYGHGRAPYGDAMRPVREARLVRAQTRAKGEASRITTLGRLMIQTGQPLETVLAHHVGCGSWTRAEARHVAAAFRIRREEAYADWVAKRWVKL